MTSYETLDAQLQGRNRQSRKVANNTYAHRNADGSIGIRLHATDVVTYFADGTVVLNSGGWLTVTTKARMSEFGPAWMTVSSVKGRWFVTLNRDWDNPVAYADGITLKDGQVISGAADDPTAEDRRNAAAAKAIRAYVNSITPEEVVRVLEDTAGDCFFCQAGQTTGDHLELHVSERYLMGSLIVNAIRAKGYGDGAISLVYGLAKQGKVDSILKASLTRMLRRAMVTGVAVK